MGPGDDKVYRVVDGVEMIDFAPRQSSAHTLCIGLYDVRASPTDLRITYDFDRDGWVIQRQTDEGEWLEAAFVGDEDA